MNQVFTSETYGDLSRKIEEFMENYDVYDYDNVTIVTEKVNGEKPDNYHWKATLIPKDTASALKELLVEEYGYVDVFWHEDDILGRLDELFEDDEIPCDTLTQEQLAAVKHDLSSTHDAEQGLTWEGIDCAIRSVFEEDNSEEFRHITNQYTPDEQ